MIDLVVAIVVCVWVWVVVVAFADGRGVTDRDGLGSGRVVGEGGAARATHRHAENERASVAL